MNTVDFVRLYSIIPRLAVDKNMYLSILKTDNKTEWRAWSHYGDIVARYIDSLPPLFDKTATISLDLFSKILAKHEKYGFATGGEVDFKIADNRLTITLEDPENRYTYHLPLLMEGIDPLPFPEEDSELFAVKKTNLEEALNQIMCAVDKTESNALFQKCAFIEIEKTKPGLSKFEGFLLYGSDGVCMRRVICPALTTDTAWKHRIDPVLLLAVVKKFSSEDTLRILLSKDKEKLIIRVQGYEYAMPLPVVDFPYERGKEIIETALGYDHSFLIRAEMLRMLLEQAKTIGCVFFALLKSNQAGIQFKAYGTQGSIEHVCTFAEDLPEFYMLLSVDKVLKYVKTFSGPEMLTITIPPRKDDPVAFIYRSDFYIIMPASQEQD